jgi:hypothetical protein
MRKAGIARDSVSQTRGGGQWLRISLSAGLEQFG